MGQQPEIVMELMATCMCNSMDLPHMHMYISHSYVVCGNVVDAVCYIRTGWCLVCGMSKCTQ